MMFKISKSIFTVLMLLLTFVILDVQAFDERCSEYQSQEDYDNVLFEIKEHIDDVKEAINAEQIKTERLIELSPKNQELSIKSECVALNEVASGDFKINNNRYNNLSCLLHNFGSSFEMLQDDVNSILECSDENSDCSFSELSSIIHITNYSLERMYKSLDSCFGLLK